MKHLDLPPVWLFGFVVLTWFSRAIWTWGTPALHSLGTGLVLLGVILMVLAVFEMTRRRTTVIPGKTPTSLVTGGIFRFSRNPIYLGDVLVLFGLALRWGAPLGVVLAVVFLAVIRARFVLPEESRLNRAFGAEFAEYLSQTRRWI